MSKNKKNMEPMSNIGSVHQDEVEQRRLNYQASTDNKYRKLDYVQSGIKVCNGGALEHMWVFVLEVNEENKTITGTLGNDPLHPNSLVNYGDKITVRFEDIEALIPHTYNASEN